MDLNFISALNEGNELAHDMKKKGNSLFLQAIHNIVSYFWPEIWHSFLHPITIIDDDDIIITATEES